MSELLDPAQAVDLSNCEREPIHIPGSIQPHGVLLACSEPGLVVQVASGNCAALLGLGPGDVLGRTLGEVMPGALAGAVAFAAAAGGTAEPRQVSGAVSIGGEPVEVDAVVHRSDGLLVLEIEPADGPLTVPNSFGLTRAALARITRTTDLHELCAIAVEEVRRLTGFDRVMVYRFDGDWNGEVVAEDRAEGLNTFLGLRYPASDIPSQARALYRRNWLRLIVDAGYRPSPLVPAQNPLTGTPLDLSRSMLRSVSPIHLEYLRNMGVRASMSISLLDRDELWGLIACHHYAGPHRPPYETRVAAELLGQSLSLRLAEAVRLAEGNRVREARAVQVRLTAAATNETRPAALSLTEDPVTVLDLIPSEGAVVSLEGIEASVGTVPPTSALGPLAGYLLAAETDVLRLDSVPGVLAGLAAYKDTMCGALMVRLPGRQFVAWFRPELVHTISWGGDPHNKALAIAEGDEVRIGPRRSFERWQEIVQDQAEPWTPTDVVLATDFRRDLVNALYARSRHLASIAATLRRSLLPDSLPRVPGWSLAGEYRPSLDGDVGGDWYDAILLPSGRIACVMGDVAGHGLDAAGPMGQLRNGLRAYLVEEPSPGRVLQRLSRLAGELLPTVFATATIAVVDPATGEARIASAGHPPVCLAPPGRDAVILPVEPSPPLGALAEMPVPAEVRVQVAPGAALVLYSDGMVERRTEPLETGLARLVAVVQGGGEATRLCASLIQDCRDPSAEDDATVLVLRRDPGTGIGVGARGSRHGVAVR